MGAEVALDVESDTGILRSKRAKQPARDRAAFPTSPTRARGPAHPILGRRLAGVLFVLATASSCRDGGGPSSAASGAPAHGDRERAQAIVDGAAVLPDRPEAVALADAIAIAA